MIVQLLLLSIGTVPQPCNLSAHTSNPGLTWLVNDWCQVQMTHASIESMVQMTAAEAVATVLAMKPCTERLSTKTFAGLVCGNVMYANPKPAVVPEQCQPPANRVPDTVAQCRFWMTDPKLCPCGIGKKRPSDDEQCTYNAGACAFQYNLHAVRERFRDCSTAVEDYDERVKLHTNWTFDAVYLADLEACSKKHRSVLYDPRIKLAVEFGSFVTSLSEHNGNVRSQRAQTWEALSYKCQFLKPYVGNHVWERGNINVDKGVQQWWTQYCSQERTIRR